MYTDWMNQFQSQFQDLISSGAIPQLEIGLGPCGEARYPSYQLKYWSYPGCGEFQCYDAEFTKLLSQDATNAGHSDWGYIPANYGSYNTKPGESCFWRDDCAEGWSSSYGRWFIKWYATKLNEHSDRVLGAARDVFKTAKLSTKISGIHWWYLATMHCAETTGGYNNFIDYDGYRDLISIFKKHDCQITFTCLEMNPDSSAESNPPYLVQQIINDAAWAGLEFEGENALAIYDWGNYDRCCAWVSKGLKQFTYLRMCDTLFENNNFNNFKGFVTKMHDS